LAGDERCARIEEVLAVVYIEHGVGAVWVPPISRWNVDDEVPLVWQVGAGKVAMQAEAAVRRRVR
jgi:hypothetical protein